MRKLFIALVVVIALVAVGSQYQNWAYHHPAISHDCRMMASICPSHQAQWTPNAPPVSTYSSCTCSATTHAVVGTG
jgi:hypothetical protein